jgi:nucleoside-diphosphate-sugar epimerase
MVCLVTGANGFIGSHMCELLVEGGETVRGLVRERSDLTWLEGLDIELVRGDLRSCDSLEAAARGVDTVFHTAASLRPRDPADYEKVNYEGTRMLAEVCARAGVSRFVLFSSAAASGPSSGPDRPSTEEDEPRPVSGYGRGKLRAEVALREMADRMHSVVLRFPAVYGPRDRDGLFLFRTMKRGIRPVLGGELSLVYVRDAVRAAFQAARGEVSSGSVYFVSDGRCHRFDEVAAVVERLLGRRTLRVRLPAWAMKAGARVNQWLTREGSIFNLDKAEEFAHDSWVISIDKARRELGFEPEYPLEEGMRRTVEWYREKEWL